MPWLEARARVLVPASLRAQWRDELQGKFGIDAEVVDGDTVRAAERNGLRMNVSLLVESGEPREVMHMALLLGYGASAINPYLAFETVADLALKAELDARVGVARAVESSTCRGTALKSMSRPPGSRASVTIPDRSMGGSPGETRPCDASGMSSRGPSRYQ